MIHSLLQIPDSPNARRDKLTGGYTYGLYHRDRVLAVAQSTEGRAAKRRWDETLRGNAPNPGWTTRLGDIGRPLGITAIAAGKLLEQLGYRSNKHVTDAAVAAGCGVRRWDGFATHDDWHLDRAVAAIRSAAEVRGNLAVLMRSPLRSLRGRREKGWWPSSMNRSRRMPHVGKRRRLWCRCLRLSCERYARPTQK
jgi:choline dehydrogenase-like flavoprotein